MGLQADVSPFGSQTVTGPGWPNVDEDALAAAAAQYEALAAKLTGSVVPQQQGQLMKLSDNWKGGGALAATGEATTIIGGHEANGAQAAAIAAKLRSMEVTVARTKTLVNATAMETQRECEAISAMPVSNTQELVQSRIKLGLSQNIAYVNANASELAAGLGVPPNIPNPGAPPTAQAQQAADKGSQQAMQMLSQIGQMAMQLPQQIGGMLTQAPQQLMQPLQQLSQPLQQLTSMFSGGKGGSGGAGAMPFSSFSNHPLAGGSGAGGGAGMVRAASTPGSGGVPLQTPLMANLMGNHPAGGAVPGAGSAAVGGVAPVASGGAGMGGMGMMGQRGEGNGGSAASLGVPAPLEYDLGDDVDDDW
jgi:hypothetical protein